MSEPVSMIQTGPPDWVTLLHKALTNEWAWVQPTRRMMESL